MENKIINTEIKESNTDAILKRIDALNTINDAGGEWIYVEGKGICWHLTDNPDNQTGETKTPTENPPSVLSELVQWGNLIDFDNLAQNSVVLIKLNVEDTMRVNMLQRAIAKQVLEPRIEKLKEKRICILFMQSGDDISVMTEEEMNAAGWEKKDKSRIITDIR